VVTTPSPERQPDDGVAIIGEGRTRVQIVRGRDAHHRTLERGGIDEHLLAIVPRGRGANESGLVGVIQCRGKLRRIYREVEAHIDDIRAVLHGVIDRAHDVGEETCAIRMKSFKRQQIRLRTTK